MLQIACGQWHATILPEHGANVISLRCGDEQILRMPDTEQDFAAHPCLYGLPILLPANRVADGAFPMRDGSIPCRSMNRIATIISTDY